MSDASSPPSSSSTPDDSTNTLVLTGLPREFFHSEVLEPLRHLFASYGEINQWVPLRSLVRVIIVYLYDEDAVCAKAGYEALFNNANGLSDSLQGLRLYFADRNPLRFDASVPNVHYLKVPELEKNFLISPPGSPPAGWEPIREDPPNPTPLADDIMAALRHLQLMQKSPGIEMVLDPNEGSGITICVEDCQDCRGEDDTLEDSDWSYGETNPSRNRWKVSLTSLPPLHATVQ